MTKRLVESLSVVFLANPSLPNHHFNLSSFCSTRTRKANTSRNSLFLLYLARTPRSPVQPWSGKCNARQMGFRTRVRGPQMTRLVSFYRIWSDPWTDHKILVPHVLERGSREEKNWYSEEEMECEKSEVFHSSRTHMEWTKFHLTPLHNLYGETMETRKRKHYCRERSSTRRYSHKSRKFY